MRDFISAAFPLVVTGLALAVLAARCGAEKQKNRGPRSSRSGAAPKDGIVPDESGGREAFL